LKYGERSVGSSLGLPADLEPMVHAHAAAAAVVEAHAQRTLALASRARTVGRHQLAHEVEQRLRDVAPGAELEDLERRRSLLRARARRGRAEVDGATFVDVVVERDGLRRIGRTPSR
jgi:hypothetical protein